MTREHTVVARTAILCDARRILGEDYARESLCVDDVARRVATSRRHLQRCFSEHGTTFREVLRGIRVEHAMRLLIETDLPIAVIAGRVGYRQTGLFTNAFRRHAGLNPSEVRARRRVASAAGRGERVLPDARRRAHRHGQQVRLVAAVDADEAAAGPVGQYG